MATGQGKPEPEMAGQSPAVPPGSGVATGMVTQGETAVLAPILSGIGGAVSGIGGAYW